jgi:DNA-binding transcriptional ArsR family regulator
LGEAWAKTYSGASIDKANNSACRDLQDIISSLLDSISYYWNSRTMKDQNAIEALSALAHPARLQVFKLLAKTGASGVPAGEIARQVGVPVTTMSTHLGILSRAGLIGPKRESRTVYYALNVEGARDLFAYLMADCCGGRPDLCQPAFDAAELACCPPAPNLVAAHEPV